MYFRGCWKYFAKIEHCRAAAIGLRRPARGHSVTLPTALRAMGHSCPAWSSFADSFSRATRPNMNLAGDGNAGAPRTDWIADMGHNLVSTSRVCPSGWWEEPGGFPCTEHRCLRASEHHRLWARLSSTPRWPNGSAEDFVRSFPTVRYHSGRGRRREWNDRRLPTSMLALARRSAAGACLVHRGAVKTSVARERECLVDSISASQARGPGVERWIGWSIVERVKPADPSVGQGRRASRAVRPLGVQSTATD